MVLGYLTAGAQALGAITSAYGQLNAPSPGEQAARQYETQMNLYKNQLKFGPGWEVHGLKAAGINPMFRYGKGGSMTQLGSTSAGIPQYYNPAAGFADVASSAAQAYRTTTESKKNEAQTEKIGGELQHIHADIKRIHSTTRLSNAQRDLALAKVQTELQERWLKIAQINLSREELQRVTAQIRNIDQDTINKGLVSALLTVQAQLAHQRIPQAERDAWWANTWWRTFWDQVVNPVMSNVPFVTPKPGAAGPGGLQQPIGFNLGGN